MAVDQLTLIKTPARNASVSNVSVWGAAFNPQVFNYQRKDYEITGIAEFATGLINVTIDTVLTTDEADAIIGSFVKIKTDNYDHSLEVKNAYPGGSSTDLVLYSDDQYTADPSTGYLISETLKSNFKVKTTLTIDGKKYILRHSPDNNGFVRADMVNILQQFLVADDQFAYDIQDYIDRNLFVPYDVDYTYEYMNIEEELQTADNTSAGRFYVTYSALQIGNPLGSNMGEYVPFLVEANPDKLAKFLTVFKEPVFNIGYPFDIAFIYSEKLTGKQVYIKYRPLDLNRQPLSSAGFEDVVLAVDVTNEALINNTDKVIVSSNVDETGFRLLPPGLGVCRVLMSDLYSDRAKYVEIFIYYIDAPVPSGFNYSFNQLGAPSPYVDNNLFLYNNGAVVKEVYSPENGGPVMMNAGNTFLIESKVIDPLQPSTFNWSLVTSISPYIDVDIRIFYDSDPTPVIVRYIDDSGSISLGAIKPYTISASGIEASVGSNPKIAIRITKNGVIIFQKSKAYAPADPLEYTGTVAIDATYTVEVWSYNGSHLTTIDTADVNEPKINMIVKKNGSTLFQQTIPYAEDASLTYGGIVDSGVTYQVISTSTLNTADLTPVNIPEEPEIVYDDAEVQVTEVKTIKIERPAICKDKNVYLKWLNILGGWDYQLFNYDITNSKEVSERDYYDRQVLDFETDRATEDVLFTASREVLDLQKTDLSYDDAKALAAIVDSPKVFMLLMLNPYKWLTASVDGKSQDIYNTNEEFAEFKTSIKLPKKNLQF